MAEVEECVSLITTQQVTAHILFLIKKPDTIFLQILSFKKCAKTLKKLCWSALLSY